jgi:methyl-accepting chemotaxis protein
LIGAGSETIERLARGVTNALRETRAVLTLILQMGESTRRIEKIVDGLALVGQPASWSALRVPARRIV